MQKSITNQVGQNLSNLVFCNIEFPGQTGIPQMFSNDFVSVLPIQISLDGSCAVKRESIQYDRFYDGDFEREAFFGKPYVARLGDHVQRHLMNSIFAYREVTPNVFPGPTTTSVGWGNDTGFEVALMNVPITKTSKFRTLIPEFALKVADNFSRTAMIVAQLCGLGSWSVMDLFDGLHPGWSSEMVYGCIAAETIWSICYLDCMRIYSQLTGYYWDGSGEMKVGSFNPYGNGQTEATPFDIPETVFQAEMLGGEVMDAIPMSDAQLCQSTFDIVARHAGGFYLHGYAFPSFAKEERALCEAVLDKDSVEEQVLVKLKVDIRLYWVGSTIDSYGCRVVVWKVFPNNVVRRSITIHRYRLDNGIIPAAAFNAFRKLRRAEAAGVLTEKELIPSYFSESKEMFAFYGTPLELSSDRHVSTFTFSRIRGSRGGSRMSYVFMIMLVICLVDLSGKILEGSFNPYGNGQTSRLSKAQKRRKEEEMLRTMLENAALAVGLVPLQMPRFPPDEFNVCLETDRLRLVDAINRGLPDLSGNVHTLAEHLHKDGSAHGFTFFTKKEYDTHLRCVNFIQKSTFDKGQGLTDVFQHAMSNLKNVLGSLGTVMVEKFTKVPEFFKLFTTKVSELPSIYSRVKTKIAELQKLGADGVEMFQKLMKWKDKSISEILFDTMSNGLQSFYNFVTSDMMVLVGSTIGVVLALIVGTALLIAKYYTAGMGAYLFGIVLAGLGVSASVYLGVKNFSDLLSGIDEVLGQSLSEMTSSPAQKFDSGAGVVIDKAQVGPASSLAHWISEFFNQFSSAKTTAPDFMNSVTDFNKLVSAAKGVGYLFATVLNFFSRIFEVAASKMVDVAGRWGVAHKLVDGAEIGDQYLERIQYFLQKDASSGLKLTAAEAFEICALHRKVNIAYLDAMRNPEKKGLCTFLQSAMKMGAPVLQCAEAIRNVPTTKVPAACITLLGGSQIGKSSVLGPALMQQILRLALDDPSVDQTEVFRPSPDKNFPYEKYKGQLGVICDDALSGQTVELMELGVRKVFELTGGQATPIAAAAVEMKGTVALQHLLAIFTENNPNWKVISEVCSNSAAVATRLQVVARVVIGVFEGGEFVESPKAVPHLGELTIEGIYDVMKSHIRFQLYSPKIDNNGALTGFEPHGKYISYEELVELGVGAVKTRLESFKNVQEILKHDFIPGIVYRGIAKRVERLKQLGVYVREPDPLDSYDPDFAVSPLLAADIPPEHLGPAIYRWALGATAREFMEVERELMGMSPKVKTVEFIDILKPEEGWLRIHLKKAVYALDSLRLAMGAWIKPYKGVLTNTLAVVAGVFAAVGAAVGAWFYFMPKFDKPDVAQSYDLKAKRLLRPQGVVVQSTLLSPAQASIEEVERRSLEATKRTNAVVELGIELVGDGQRLPVHRCYATMLTSSVGVTVYHAAAAAFTPMFQAESRITFHTEEGVFVDRIHDLECLMIGDLLKGNKELFIQFLKTFNIPDPGQGAVMSDVVFFKMPRQLRGIRDNTSMWIPSREVSNLVGREIARFCRRYEVTSKGYLANTIVNRGIVTELKSVIVEAPYMTGHIRSSNAFVCSALPEDGACGSFYAVMDDKIQGLLIGVHGATDQTDTVSKAYILTREIVEEAVKRLGGLRESKVLTELKIAPLDKAQFSCVLPPTIGIVENREHYVLSVGDKHDFVQSPFARDPDIPDFMKSKKEPSVLKMLVERDGVKKFNGDHVLQFIANKVDVGVVPKLAFECCDLVLRNLEYPPGVTARFEGTLVDIVNNKSKLKYELGASAGLAGLAKGAPGRSKASFVTVVGNVKNPIPYYHSMMERLITQIEDLNSELVMYVPATPKGETLDAEKVAAVKTRRFYPVGLDWLTAEAIYTNGAYEVLSHNGEKFNWIMGTSPKDCTRVASSLRELFEHGKVSVGGHDEKKNDVSFKRASAIILCYIYLSINDNLDIRAGMSEEKRRHRRAIELRFYMAMFNPVVIIDVPAKVDEEFRRLALAIPMWLNASGRLLTWLNNGTLHTITGMCAWRVSWPDDGFDLASYRARFRLFIYSDDGLFASNSWPHENAVAAMNMFSFGPVTEAEPYPRVIGRIPFQYAGKNYLALEYESIRQSLCFVSTSGPWREMLRMNMEGALYELAAWGPVNWATWKHHLDRFCLKHNIPMITLTYEECHANLD